MPGKVNPVLCEAVCQVVAQVVGNDAAVAWGGAAGNFELNVMLPVIARNLLESIRLLANVSRVFADRCVAGIEANDERCREYAESSPSIVTPLNHYVGYDEAAKIAKQALAERKTIREVVIERGHVPGKLSEAQLDEVLDVLSMATRTASRAEPDRARRSRDARSTIDALRDWLLAQPVFFVAHGAAGRRRPRQPLAQGHGRHLRRARAAPRRLPRLLRQRHRDAGPPAARTAAIVIMCCAFSRAAEDRAPARPAAGACRRTTPIRQRCAASSARNAITACARSSWSTSTASPTPAATRCRCMDFVGDRDVLDRSHERRVGRVLRASTPRPATRAASTACPASAAAADRLDAGTNEGRPGLQPDRPRPSAGA